MKDRIVEIAHGAVAAHYRINGVVCDGDHHDRACELAQAAARAALAEYHGEVMRWATVHLTNRGQGVASAVEILATRFADSFGLDATEKGGPR